MNKFLNELIHRIVSIVMYTLFTIFQIIEFIVLWFTHFADTVMNGRNKPLTDATNKWFQSIYDKVLKRR